MSLTLANLKSYVTLALEGGDPSVIITSADATKQEIVNQAGRYLFSMAPWHWRDRNASAMTLTSGTAYTALPSDFGSLLSYASAASGVNYRLTTIDDLAWKRSSSGTAPTGSYWFTIVWPNAGTATADLEVPRIEWYPTPTSTLTGGFLCYYRALWTELSSDTAKAKVPAFVEGLLVELVKAWARGTEYGTMSEELQAVAAGPVYGAVLSEDARLRPDWQRSPVVADGGLKS